MKQVDITPEVIEEHGLTSEEYEYILQIMGRTPTIVELGIFSVMWSEHASYKNSVKLLKTLPKEGPYMLAKAGDENAGVVDIGEGLAICFKIESHNHPSALEPYHGAATGVGGILRDIFTMGARPIAALNSLRFGIPDNFDTRYLIREAVHGISYYGNSFGVPTVGGEIYFEPCYEGNPLVNAMAVGLVKHDKIARSAAKGVGNLVVYVGAKTGRDGIHGTTFASVEISDESAQMRSAIQVGDPFYQKLLLEATLEVINAGLVVGIQDMGAAGLTCSSCEMSARGNVGMVIDIDKVPCREEGMTPYEVMLSESQERMLLVPVPGKEREVREVLGKWGLLAEEIGTVTDDGLITLIHGGKEVAQVPARALTDHAPVYHRESVRPEYIDELASYDLDGVKGPADPGAILVHLMGSHSIASKRWVYRQYDSQAGAGTVIGPGSDAAVVRLPGTARGIALTCDCNSRYCYINPRLGASHAVAEAARNLACTGARPLAATNCQNFGNPYKPEVFWQFKECIEGMADACRVLDTPITGGNVSLYNEDGETAIRPTPVIGMVGVIDDVSASVPMGFRQEGDAVVLLGETYDEIGASEYLAEIHGVEAGRVPSIDLDGEKRLCELLVEAARRGITKSAHDLSEGGFGVALAECCISGSLGVEASVEGNIAADRFLFSESAGRALVSVDRGDLATLLGLADEMGVPALAIGEVGGEALTITYAQARGDAVGQGTKTLIAVPIAQLALAYEEAI
ncbi:MAG TPA: phosphoribosylformylglycinamidine synthase subunit PurL, partial [Candidatus Cloacimonas sp.]|nr:phosphoribosylformylglycinamidine synthase subunit PurL [Candidatus Cloacimonas sp.]